MPGPARLNALRIAFADDNQTLSHEIPELSHKRVCLRRSPSHRNRLPSESLHATSSLWSSDSKCRRRPTASLTANARYTAPHRHRRLRRCRHRRKAFCHRRQCRRRARRASLARALPAPDRRMSSAPQAGGCEEVAPVRHAVAARRKPGASWQSDFGFPFRLRLDALRLPCSAVGGR